MLVVLKNPTSHEFHFSLGNIHDMPHSITEISEVGVKLPVWRVTLRLSVCDSMFKCVELAAHATLSATQHYVNLRV